MCTVCEEKEEEEEEEEGGGAVLSEKCKSCITDTILESWIFYYSHEP